MEEVIEEEETLGLGRGVVGWVIHSIALEPDFNEGSEREVTLTIRDERDTA